MPSSSQQLDDDFSRFSFGKCGLLWRQSKKTFKGRKQGLSIVSYGGTCVAFVKVDGTMPCTRCTKQTITNNYANSALLIDNVIGH